MYVLFAAKDDPESWAVYRCLPEDIYKLCFSSGKHLTWIDWFSADCKIYDLFCHETILTETEVDLLKLELL